MARGGHYSSGATEVRLRRQRKERLEYDSSGAKTVLAIVGVAIVILLLWLDYRGY